MQSVLWDWKVCHSSFEKSHQSDKEIVMGLNHLTDNAVSIPSANWVQEVNRGGLTIIIDQAQDAFMLVSSPKLRVNKAHKMDEQTRHQLQSELFSDTDVQFSWCQTGINLKINDEK